MAVIPAFNVVVTQSSVFRLKATQLVDTVATKADQGLSYHQQHRMVVKLSLSLDIINAFLLHCKFHPNLVQNNITCNNADQS